VLFKGFGDSSIDFDLLVWTPLPHQQFVLTSDLYFRIFALLKEHNIEIPFPQRDLHLRSGNFLPSPPPEQIGE
jgi:small-conductance mechanosensitive channel